MKKALLITIVFSLLLASCSNKNYQVPSGPSQEPGDSIEIQLDTSVNLPENLPSEDTL